MVAFARSDAEDVKTYDETDAVLIRSMRSFRAASGGCDAGMI